MFHLKLKDSFLTIRKEKRNQKTHLRKPLAAKNLNIFIQTVQMKKIELFLKIMSPQGVRVEAKMKQN